MFSIVNGGGFNYNHNRHVFNNLFQIYLSREAYARYPLAFLNRKEETELEQAKTVFPGGCFPGKKMVCLCPSGSAAKQRPL
jgi:hypothetical protein